MSAAKGRGDRSVATSRPRLDHSAAARGEAGTRRMTAQSPPIPSRVRREMRSVPTASREAVPKSRLLPAASVVQTSATREPPGGTAWRVPGWPFSSPIISGRATWAAVRILFSPPARLRITVPVPWGMETTVPSARRKETTIWTEERSASERASACISRPSPGAPVTRPSACPRKQVPAPGRKKASETARSHSALADCRAAVSAAARLSSWEAVPAWKTTWSAAKPAAAALSAEIWAAASAGD